jgi:hypothetical protein
MKKRILYLSVLIIISLHYNCNSQNTRSFNEGIDTVITLNSFVNYGEFYKMDYYGDYSELLNWLDDQMINKKFDGFNSFECSLFSANGDPENQIFGRNFDNPDNDVLIAGYNPPNGFASLAFTRMSDLGFAVGTNYDLFTLNQKLPLLYSAYFVPDGINEYGLTAGLASIPSTQIDIDPSKDTIFITRLIREILDNSQTVAEALEIANDYNVFDSNVHTLSHHVLVGTPTGESGVLEYADGEFRLIETENDWQVVTNTKIYNVPIEQLLNTCWRFNSLYNIMEENGGILSWSEGMSALEEVHLSCPWSAIYDMTQRGIHIAIDNNFEDITYLDFGDFLNCTNINLQFANISDNILKPNFPNPFKNSTTIEYFIGKKSHVDLSVFDIFGRKLKTLVCCELQTGNYSVQWDATNNVGEKVISGIYIYRIKCNGSNVSSQKICVE